MSDLNAFADAFEDVVLDRLRDLDAPLTPEARRRLLQAANRAAAYAEQMIRQPDIADRLKLALRMEWGIVETALAQYQVDGRQALQDAVMAGLTKLAAAALS